MDDENDTPAISRVPLEVWQMIFLECTTLAEPNPSEDEPSFKVPPPGSQPLLLSGVCQKWRLAARGYPRLWQDIVIVWGLWKKNSLSRISHYITLSGSAPKSFYMYSSSSDVPHADLEALLVGCDVLKAVCYLDSYYDHCTEDLLVAIPPAQELWLLRHLSFSGVGSPCIPSKHCRSLRKIVIEGSSAIWGEPPQVEEYLIYVKDTGSMGQPHEFLPNSTKNMRVLTIYGASFFTDPENADLTYPLIHTVKMAFNFLITQVLPRYTLPSLRRIEITTGSIITETEWESIEGRFQPSNIKEVVIGPTTHHHQLLIKYFISFTSLSTLELQGKSVDPFLSSVVDKRNEGHQVFPSLTRLVIYQYHGNGDSIISFLQTRMQVDFNPFTPSVPLLELRLEGCPYVASETRKEMRKLLYID